MKASRAKNCSTDILALQSSGGISIKNHFKHVLFLLIIVLTFFAPILFGCKSRQFKTPDSAQEQENVLIDEIRVTPKDFLLGLNAIIGIRLFSLVLVAHKPMHWHRCKKSPGPALTEIAHPFGPFGFSEFCK